MGGDEYFTFLMDTDSPMPARDRLAALLQDGLSSRAKRAVRLAALGVAVAATVAGVAEFVAHHAGALYDDAFIYFRYADNVVAGCGLRFNCADPPVEGFTSPLYLALLVLGRLASVRLTVLSQWIGGFGIGAGILLAALGVDKLARYRPGVTREAAVIVGTAVALAADHFYLLHAVIGLGTALSCAVVAAMFVAASSSRLRLLRLAVAVAILARPEALVFVPALLLLVPRERWVRYLAPLGMFLLVLTIARLDLFGAFLPNTFWAKSGGGWAHARLGFHYLLEVVGDYPLIALSPLALIPQERRRPIGFVLAGSSLWLLSFLRTGGDHFYYGRLALPLVAPLTALGVLGLYALVEAGIERKPALATLLAATLSTAVAGFVALRAHAEHHLAPLHGFPNVERWAAVGRFIRAHDPDATIATVPIGAIAWYSGARTIDLVGLTNRAVGRYGTTVPPKMLIRTWIGHEHENTAWVLAQHPDLIVMTRFQSRPFVDIRRTKAGFYSEWILLHAIKEGRTPYELYSPEVAPGLYWLMFRRRTSSGR